MGIILAESLYPGYSISKDFISNLGSTRPPVIIIKQPSATIFDTTMVLSGLLIIVAGFLLTTKDKLLKTAIIITGVGSTCIGVFPAYYGLLHDLIAVSAFLASGSAAIFAAKVSHPPFKYLSVFLGVLSLLALAIGVLIPSLVVPTLGVGGVERFVAYPSIIWLIAYGGYLMRSNTR